MLQPEIYESLCSWIDGLLENAEIPENAAAFCFNLYEESEDSSEHLFGVQLIAAGAFDENDGGDWACDEIWTSGEDIFLVDISDEPDTSPENAQRLISEMLREYLDNGKYRSILLSSAAAAAGFVEGELEILFKA